MRNLFGEERTEGEMSRRDYKEVIESKLGSTLVIYYIDINLLSTIFQRNIMKRRLKESGKCVNCLINNSSKSAFLTKVIFINVLHIS